MKTYTISEFSKEMGVCANTLRVWEEKNLLVPAFRTPTGRRMYTQQQVNDYYLGIYKTREDD